MIWIFHFQSFLGTEIELKILSIELLLHDFGKLLALIILL